MQALSSVQLTGPSPLAATGVVESVVVPLPSCPALLFPQQTLEPSFFSAQLWYPPALMAVASLSPLTATGVVLFVLVPSPNWPL